MSTRDLGVQIESTLSWNSHVDNIVGKANRVLGCIKRAVSHKAPMNVTLKLYLSLVRSHLEYGSQLWNAQSHRNAHLIERVQRSATRYILGYPDYDYQERLLRTNMLPLSYRREQADLIYLFKCLNELNDVNIENFVEIPSHCERFTRQNSSHKHIKPPRVRTERHRRSYFNRVVYSWNALPEEGRSLTRPTQFRKYLNDYFTELLHGYFDVNNKCTWIHRCLCANCRVQ